MHEPEVDATVMRSHALRWYSWDSPVGLGAFALLLSTSAALLWFAVR